MDNYYTPSIEDIRVGYECEVYWCCAEPRQWIPIKVLADAPDEYGKLSVEDVISRIGYEDVRTPFLTKEQIEAEGWIRYKNGEYDDKSYKYPEVGHIYTKSDKYISFYSNKEIEIHNNEEYSDRRTWFDGNCPSINEFRTIMKLLNIK